MKRALVTGASGFVGTHLVKALVENGHSVIAIRRGGAPSVHDERVSWVQADLSAPNEVDRLSLPDSIDVLFHLAAWTPKRTGPQDPDAIARDGILGTDALLRAVLPRLRRVVFASSLDVYGPVTGLITEKTTPRPATLYGVAKLLTESIVRQRCSEHGVGAVVLRLGHIYGPGEDAYQKLIPSTIRRILGGERAKISGDGSVRRDLLYVADAVSGLLAAGIRGTGETINLCAGVSHSIREVVATIAAQMGAAGEVEDESTTGQVSASYEFDIAVARRVLAFAPTTQLGDGLASEIAHMRLNARG